jgi:hypothetical protein
VHNYLFYSVYWISHGLLVDNKNINSARCAVHAIFLAVGRQKQEYWEFEANWDSIASSRAAWAIVRDTGSKRKRLIGK